VAADLKGIHGSGIRRWPAQPGRRAGNRVIAGPFRPGRGYKRRTGAESVGAPLSRDGSPPGKAPAPVLPPRTTGEPS
jgi:hypothetical protein